MSIKLIINVIKQCKRKPSEKLMLIILSDFANVEAECFPSFETLASLCNISTRQAQNIIYKLAREGEIAISHREGGSNSYRILNYLKPIPHETHFVGKPTKFVAKHPVQTASTHETHFVPPTKFLSPTHETHFVPPTKPISSDPVIDPPREPVKANYVVAPVGDDESRTPLTTSDNPDVTHTTTPPPMAEIQPPAPVTSTAIEASATSSILPNQSNIQTHATTPPIAPPREVTRKRSKPVADDKAPHPYSDQQKMVGAVAKAFGWDMSKLTPSNRGLVGKVARDLLEASAKPADIPALYDFCQAQNWSGAFGPAALTSQWANYYALKHKSPADTIENDTGMVFRLYVPTPNRKPMLAYERVPLVVTEAELGNSPKTPEERKAEFECVIAELTAKMVLTDVDLDALPDDPELRAILW